MSSVFPASFSTASMTLLALALLLALSFEFINGFHDTANCVATVIYTHTLKPNVAVLWAGCWCLIGTATSSGAVAFGIIALLPVELIVDAGSETSFAMIFALLASAIIWNFGTWYFAIPASSSHTLIGAIIGVGLANSMLLKGAAFGDGINWYQVKQVGLSLLISPVAGFAAAALLFLLLKLLVRRPELFRPAVGEKPPPAWIRGLLILTCTGVSFSHGSNDGQKGMGLIMLILVSILPAAYALEMTTPKTAVETLVASAREAAPVFDSHVTTPAYKFDEATANVADFLDNGEIDDEMYAGLAFLSRRLVSKLQDAGDFSGISNSERRRVRREAYLIADSISRLDRAGALADHVERDRLLAYRDQLNAATQFIPFWVKMAVALAMGIGTLVGWRRIVVTIGERIGKDHLTYGQGATAELVAAMGVAAADQLGLPVSTTHVLSSSVAGTMFANRSGLQQRTVRTLLLTWVLTVPACVFLGSLLFAAGLSALALLGLR
jgi:PiT family inorganic phosphate transporter